MSVKCVSQMNWLTYLHMLFLTGVKNNSYGHPAAAKSFSCVRLCATPWTAAYKAPPSMDLPGKSTGVGCHCLLCKWACRRQQSIAPSSQGPAESAME